MDDKQWETKFKAFLQKTGDDFKRFGNDVKQEAQKLIDEVKDPAGQERIRENLKSATVWARKAAEEVADVVVDGTRKAEEAFMKATERAKDFATKPADGGAPADDEASPSATPPSPPPEGMPSPAPAPAKKTVGKSAKPKKGGAKKSTRAKKTIGKKKKADGEEPA